MGEKSPLISVCIANYNGEKLLSDCIDSVLDQDVLAAVEIIVHDDASSDASLDLLQTRYPQVKVIASPSNVGFCVSNNRMVDVAAGDYVLLFNNDAALAPCALSALLAEQRRIAGPCVLSLPQYDWDSGALVDRGCLLDPFYNPVPNLDPARRDVGYVIGACLWLERRLWQELDGFPEWMESIGEDLFLCGLARLREVPVRCIDGSRYRHRQGASFGGNRVDGGLRSTYRRRALSERNKTLALLVCTPGWAAWPLLMLHLSLLCAEGALISLLRRDARLWREVYRPVPRTVLGSLDRWKALRRRVQSTTCTTPREWWSAFVWLPRKLSLLWRHGVPEVR
ncbi:glycosyltransferase family 2 protein [Luteimonas sp. WGS1318]|uniref:glycosyltransferase family 2 protein n=1 Tax=Luteimonas sp. WGS1318 TaxID=3366815 RepID=UPI00372D0CDE